MKRITTILIFCLSAFVCTAQITKTEEVSSTMAREVAHLREVHKLDMEAMKVALDLQAKEYERRLTQLNHEAARLALMVPRDEYEKFEDRIEEDIKDIRSWQDNMTGKIAIAIGIIGLFLWYMNYSKEKKKVET